MINRLPLFYLTAAGRAATGVALVLLAGCAGLSADAGLDDVSRLTQARIGQPVRFTKSAAGAANAGAARAGAATTSADTQTQGLLVQPLTAESAVQLALRNNGALKAALAELGVAEANVVQAGRLRNPSLGFGRVRGGGDAEIDRSVMFDIAGLLTLPARARIEQGRFEQAKLQAAAQAVALADATRRAYFTAVAAAQSAAFAGQVRGAAEASAQLAEGMAKAGNWSKLDQAREQAFHQDAQVRLARAQHEATAAREQLVRLLGLGDAQAVTLPERLPDLPDAPRAIDNAEATALAERLDMLAARRDTEATAAALGLTRATGFISVFDAGYANKSTSGQPRENGYQVTLELPIFDWGSARTARAEALYMQSVQRSADAAVRARSQVREAYSAYRSSYAIARQYRDEIVPLRKQISDEVLLRYNGMLASVFELLADAREQLTSVNAAIDAQRDFWIADARLHTAVHGGSIDDTRTTP